MPWFYPEFIMRICFYSAIRGWPWAAPDYVWPAAALAFLERGDSVLILVPATHQGRPEVATLRQKGAVIQAVPDYEIGGGRLADIRRLLNGERFTGWRLTRRLRHFQPDLVFVNQGGASCALAELDLMKFLRSTATPYVLFCRSNYRQPVVASEQTSSIRQLYAGARKVLFNSQWMLELTQNQIMTRLHNAGIFPHVVRFDRSAPLDWPESELPLLASVSRLDAHHKGLDVLLEAVSLLKAEGAKFRLQIAGYGPDGDWLKDYAKFLGVADMVSFSGRCDDIPGLWRRNHMLLLVSRYEGLGVTMLEAMACGRPVLRTPYGGADWVEDGKTGFICPAPEPGLIAQTIQRALSCYALWREMGVAAHAALTGRLCGNPEGIYLEIAEEVSGGAEPAFSEADQGDEGLVIPTR